MFVHGRACRLNQVHVATAHALLHFDMKFAVRKASERSASERRTQTLRHRGGKREVRRANENDPQNVIALLAWPLALVFKPIDDSVHAEDVPCVYLGHFAFGPVGGKPFQRDHGIANGHANAVGLN